MRKPKPIALTVTETVEHFLQNCEASGSPPTQVSLTYLTHQIMLYAGARGALAERATRSILLDELHRYGYVVTADTVDISTRRAFRRGMGHV